MADTAAGAEEADKNSFVEIALADPEAAASPAPAPSTATPTESADGSRPVTALRRAGLGSWPGHEAYNCTEEMTEGGHTALATQPESLALPDSLNEFCGEEYQTPALYPDSLGAAPAPAPLPAPQEEDSLQFPGSPAAKSPVDSLIEIGPNKTKINAAEFFDSITSLDKKQTNIKFGPRRRILPYCDNSLSSGTSAFTSQDVSFDSKDSSNSPSDSDRTRQVQSRE